MMPALRNLGTAIFLSGLIAIVGTGCSKEKKEDDGTMGAAVDAGLDTDLAAEARNQLKAVYFAYDRFNISDSAKATLQQNAQWLKSNPTVVVQVEGHCDERGSIEYNLALGDRRAGAVKTYLIQLGLDANRVSTISLGEERPSDSGHNDSAWAKNRRSEFVVISQ